MRVDIKKYRGSRTCGGGSHKKRRGAGSRGGRGKAGSHKSKFVKFLLEGYQKGKHGFKRPPEVIKEKNTINLSELEELVSSDSYEGDVLYVDTISLGFDKVLGKGKITRPMKVVAKEFSSKAIEKIKEAGGEAVIG